MTHDDEETIQFPESIWLGGSSHIPQTADAVVIRLAASPSDTLNWNLSAANTTTKVIFELDLGLFQKLELPLDDSIQLASLHLTLREFKNKTAHLNAPGVILGRVQAEELFEISWNVFEREEFLKKFKTAPELAALTPSGRFTLKFYALSRHLDFLKALTDTLSDSMQPLLLIDCASLAGKIEDLLLYNRELFEPIICVLKNSHFHQTELYWDDNYLRTEKHAHEKRIGLVLPPHQGYQTLKTTLEALDHYHVYPICQEYITTSWGQLDWIIVSSESCDLDTVRSLKGFIAAGGQIASLDTPIPGCPSIPIREALRCAFVQTDN